MTTTGQYLVSLSSLPSGSALAHLMAIQVGTGAGETFYGRTVRVITSHPETFVQRKARNAVSENKETAPRVSAPKKINRINPSYGLVAQNNSYCFTKPKEGFVLVQHSRTSPAGR